MLDSATADEENPSLLFIQELRKAVGDENIEAAIQNIRTSDIPQFSTLNLLSNGNPRLLNQAMNTINNCGIRLPISYQFPIRFPWSNGERKTYEIPNIFPDKLNEIKKFMELKGNPYRPIDIIYRSNQDHSFLSSDLKNIYINQNDWHGENYDVLRVFSEISNPDTKGDLDDIMEWSYTKVKYSKSYPKCSGSKACDILLLNRDWIACEQDTQYETRSKRANIAQVTDEMKDIEDFSNDLDVLVSRNKNVYRMLLHGGPECASFSQTIADEFNELFDGKGSFFVELLKKFPGKVYPIVLNKLKKRAKKLYLRKIEEPIRWSKKLETISPVQRTVFRKNLVKRLKTSEIFSIIGKKINYPVNQVYLLTKFVSIARANMPVDPATPNLDDDLQKTFRKILNELRNSTPRIMKITFYHAACIYCAAYFVHEVCTFDVIDNIEISSVKTAVEIGITDVQDHGYQRILNIIADSINQRKIKKTVVSHPTNNAVLEISGLAFNIDLDTSAKLVQIGNLFFKLLKDFALEPPGEAPFIKCIIGSGEIMLLSSGNEMIQINLRDSKK